MHVETEEGGASGDTLLLLYEPWFPQVKCTAVGTQIVCDGGL